jgi:hypothetical protein
MQTHKDNKMKKDTNKTNNLLMLVAVLAVAIALINLAITVNKIENLKELSGHAVDTGDVNVTIVNQAVINFNTSTINWGSGAVDVGQASATLDTDAGTVSNGNWTAIGYSLSLQNDGNTNVSFTLQSDKNAASFIGGTGPSYQVKVSNNETNACGSISHWSTYADINTTETEACSNMGYSDSADLVNIDVKLVIPRDAVGVKGSVITATATPV